MSMITAVGMKTVRIISAVIAIAMLLGSSYVLWDMWHDEMSAFSTYDMLQYRPNVENGEPATLEEIKAINDDARAWLTIYKTHVDYPVMQGKTDLEYINKTPLGKTAPTGSIYLATENNAFFKDRYNLVYGHHMNNGAMFGDIVKYSKRVFFNNHKKGILITEDKIYDIEVFAYMKTSAYDSKIYNSSQITNKPQLDEFLKYIKEKSKYFVKLNDIEKVIAFSTCDDSLTDGRSVLFAKLSKHTGPFEQYEEKKPPIALGHDDRYWAFLNLVCMLVTIYLVFPIHIWRAKVKRKKAMGVYNRELEKVVEEANCGEATEEYVAEPFSKRYKKGFILEVITALISVIVFVLTEDIRYPIQMIDAFTPVMLVLLLLALLIDINMIRYVDGIKKDQKGGTM